VISLTQRRLAALPADDRPLPSVEGLGRLAHAVDLLDVDDLEQLAPTGEVSAIAAAHYLRVGSRLKEPSPDSELDDRALNTHRIKG